MPIFTLTTNLPLDKIPQNFIQTTAEVVAKTLGKPSSYVVVHVNAGQLIGWAGGSAPCAIAYLSSIGQISREANKKHSAALFSHIEKQLGIPGDKMYINFQDLDKSNVGYVGKTFDDLL